MSYLVLARKYRPVSFSQVIGQEHITKTLAGAISSGRLAHAFCFTGPRGVGKTSVARILAKALNCKTGPTPTPCGTCPACREIEEGRAVDVQEIDAASNSGVDDVRELREMIRYRPQAWRYRITILDEVHMLSRQAFNALLKTLEEPPEHAVFILATTDVHKLLPTVLSRCQRYDFRRLPPRLLARHLAEVCQAEGFSLSEESLMLLAHEADGSTRDALSLLDQIFSYGERNVSHQQMVELLGLIDRTLVKDCAQAILRGNGAHLLDIIEQVYQAGGEMEAFYSNLQEHFRNLAASLALPPNQAMLGVTAEEISQLREQASAASPETLHEIFAHLAATEEMFRRASAPRLVMEMALLKLTQLKPVIGLDKIVNMLEKLEPAALAISPEQLRALLPTAEIVTAPEQKKTVIAPEQKKNELNVARPGKTTAPSGATAQELLLQLVDYLRKPEASLAARLRQAKARWQDGSLVVELQDINPMRQYCTPEKQAALNRYMAELYAAKSWDNPPTISISLQAVEQSEQTTTIPPMQEIYDHPSIRAAMEVLQAHPVEVKPWVKPSPATDSELTESLHAKTAERNNEAENFDDD